ncbi:probable serine/threonine-protein kinase PBL7, partial [Tanacetum coccineum]
LYMPKYLRKPTSEDVVKIQQKHNNVHDFPGMLGSIDCMHWEWKNCPVSWQGQYGRGDKKYPTIMLEAVASQDLWISLQQNLMNHIWREVEEASEED